MLSCCMMDTNDDDELIEQKRELVGDRWSVRRLQNGDLEAWVIVEVVQKP